MPTQREIRPIDRQCLAVRDELNRTGPDIANGARCRHGGLAHRSPPLGVEIWRRRLLDYLLIAPLDRAVALEEVDRVAVAVGEDLDFDVAELLKVLFDQHAIVAKGGGCLA